MYPIAPTQMVTMPAAHFAALNMSARIAALAEVHTLTGGTPPWLMTFTTWMQHTTDQAGLPQSLHASTFTDAAPVLVHPHLVEYALHDRQVARCARYLERRLARAGIDLGDNPYPVGALLVVAHVHQQHRPGRPLRTGQALRLLASFSEVELEFLSLDRHGSELRDRRGNVRAEATAIDARLEQLLTYAIPCDDNPAIVSDRGWTGVHPRAQRR